MVFVLAVGGGAHAQDSAAAEALFDKGVAAMKAGNYAVGCPALAESQRIDPHPGTMFTLADCEAKWGKVATAAADYADYLRMVAQLPEARQKAHADRKTMAEESLAKLKPTVPQLTLVLPKGAPADTVVKRDGMVQGAPVLGTALPVDPGDHVIVTQVPGGSEHQMRIHMRLRESKTVQVEIDPTPLGSSAISATPEASSSDSASIETKPLAPSNETGLSERRYQTGMWVAGGVGGAGLVLWGVTGLMAASKKSTASENCSGSVCNSQAGKDAGDSARTLAQVATVGLGVGVAGLATGVVLYFVGAPKTKRETARTWEPVVAADGHATSVGIRGVW